MQGGSAWVRAASSGRWLAFVVVALALALVGVVPASADWSTTASGEPATATVDPLPTVQINGVAWSQVVIGNTVFAAGNFTSARPAGAAPGAQEVPRTHLLAYDIRTGALLPFNPSINGQILSIAKSPDNKRLYIGGQFTAVNGKVRNRLAAFDVPASASGTPTPTLATTWQPMAGTTVRAITATTTTVYVGGDFNKLGPSASMLPRAYIGALSAADGAVLSWNPGADNQVLALTMNPSGSLLVAGGRFTKLSGVSAYGMGAVDSATGAAKPWAMTSTVRNAGAESAITSLSADSDSVYGTGYVYGTGGNFEGTFRADGATGALRWIADCHGDHYSAFAQNGVVYDAGHAHYCGNAPSGFRQTNPFTYYHAGAWTKSATAVLTYNPVYQRANFSGKAAPSLLHWYPVWTVGTFTGQSQAAWNVSGNADYVVYGGEFQKINGKAQQGLVRFARAGLVSEKKAAPQAAESLTPAAVSVVPGEVRLGWQATFDRDNRSLTYKLYRGNLSSQTAVPIFTTTVTSTPWWRPSLTFKDVGLAPGSTQRYRLYTYDAAGANVASADVSVVVAGTGNGYAQSVLASGPQHWWRMDDPTGTKLADSGSSAAALAPSTTLLTGGQSAAAGNTGTAVKLGGNAGSFAAIGVPQDGPQVFSVEAWIKTGTTKGGRIVGFGDAQLGASKVGLTDRHLFMDNSGAVYFGVEPTPGTKRTLVSKMKLNDGSWHHLVGTLGPNGMNLYVDGALTASRTDTTGALPSMGVWKVGGDTLANWTVRPSSDYIAATLDEVAVYPKVLSASEVAAHFAAATPRKP